MDEFVLLVGVNMYSILYIECSLCSQTAEATAAVVLAHCKYCIMFHQEDYSIFYFLNPYFEDTTIPLGHCTVHILFSYI